MKAVEEERGSKGKEREGRWGAWQPPEAGNLTPRTSRPSGQLTAISSMRWPTSCTAGGGEGERHAEKVCVWERERGGETRLYLFAEASLKRAGQQRKRGVRTERREELHVPRSKELDSAVHLSVSVSQRRSIPGHPVFTSAIRGYQTSAGLWKIIPTELREGAQCRGHTSGVWPVSSGTIRSWFSSTTCWWGEFCVILTYQRGTEGNTRHI